MKRVRYIFIVRETFLIVFIASANICKEVDLVHSGISMFHENPSARRPLVVARVQREVNVEKDLSKIEVYFEKIVCV